MGEFFGSIYCWFEDFFGLDLANYLWGVAVETQQKNLFIGIGLLMFTISLVSVVVYYYAVNHPRLNNWWGWCVFLAVNTMLNFIAGWQWVQTDLNIGKMDGIDIGEGECLCFGVSNMFLSLMAFILFSYMLKWWSSNCARAPF